jgi:hypothetical protein
VLIESEWPSFASVAVRKVYPERFPDYYDASAGSVRERFFDTLGARLLFGGARAKATADTSSVGFLRLVHVSPVPDPDPVLRAWSERWPCAFVYERVAGARLRAKSPPGSVLRVEIPLRFPQPTGAYSVVWRGEARADAEGRVELRVPYATGGPTTGDGRLAGTPTWRLGGESGHLVLTEADVTEGRDCPLPPRK